MMTPAEKYARWRESAPGFAEEPLISTIPRTISELELQARWFSGEFPRQLETVEGRPVEIIQYGVWNREPGPDFQGAVIRIGNDPPLHGPIEIDLDRRDWERHGHAINPAYTSVVLHLFVEPGPGECFTRSSQHRLIPQVRLSLAGLDAARPFPPLAQAGRCSAPLADLPLERTVSLLRAAAHFRLVGKSHRLLRLTGLHGPSETLFQGLARALGYKENKLPFELLAQRLPLAVLRRKPVETEARLFGCAGFLDAPDLAAFPGDTRSYLRGLWDGWWTQRAALQHLILPRAAWKFTGARPMNHPQRRLAALAGAVANWRAIEASFDDPNLAKITASLGKIRHPYWENHYTLTSAASPRPMSLLGESRIIDILVNLAIPLALPRQPDLWQMLEKVRQPLQNRPLETAALRLFQTDAERRKLLDQALYQQGLLQIYEDFCLRDLTDCQRCPFPEKARAWPVD